MVIFAVVLFSPISRVSPNKIFNFNTTSSHREFAHLVQNRENIYSTRKIRHNIQYFKSPL